MLGSRLAKANQIARRLWEIYFPEMEWWQHLRKQGIYADCVGSYRKVRRPCSCWMCGNPRKYFGAPNRQELKAPSSMDNQDKNKNSGIGLRPVAPPAGSLRYH